MRTICFGVFLALSLTATAAEEEEEAKTYPLWPDGAPGAFGKG